VTECRLVLDASLGIIEYRDDRKKSLSFAAAISMARLLRHVTSSAIALGSRAVVIDQLDRAERRHLGQFNLE
jgi:hypothetical protein